MDKNDITKLAKLKQVEVWKKSINNRAIVSNRPTIYKDPLEMSAYGGYLVCESVDPECMPLILAAPSLLALSEALVDEVKRLRAALDTAIVTLNELKPVIVCSAFGMPEEAIVESVNKVNEALTKLEVEQINWVEQVLDTEEI